MTTIGIGLVGTGYMGKAHAVALKSVGAVFNTKLRPVCEVICSTTVAGAARKAAEYGFNASTSHWQELITNPRVEAIVIASPQTTHRQIALEAIAAGKPVFCEKPLGASLEDARAMAAAAAASGVPNMVGFNYIRAPAMQLAREGVATGLLSIPNRYMHSPVEVVSLTDLDCAARLLAEFCLSVTSDANWVP